jgi:hypothetical protein
MGVCNGKLYLSAAADRADEMALSFRRSLNTLALRFANTILEKSALAFPHDVKVLLHTNREETLPQGQVNPPHELPRPPSPLLVKERLSA